MRKRIFKGISVLLVFAVLLCNNSIAIFASEAENESFDDFAEEILSEEVEDDVIADEASEENDEISVEDMEEEDSEITDDADDVSDEIEDTSVEEEEIEEPEAEAEEIVVGEVEIIDSGVSNDITWEVDSNGKLTISGTGNWIRDSFSQNPPWCTSTNRTFVKSVEVNLTGTTNASRMFYYLENLESADLDGFDTSSVSNMTLMFGHCGIDTTSLELDLSSWDTSKVTSMSEMFWCCHARKIDVSKFDTSHVSNMYKMFWSCENVEELDVSKFVTTQVINMEGMFYGCGKINTIDVGGFSTAKVSSMNCMFYGCKSLKSLDVSSFDTNKVTDMGNMFGSCENIEKLELSNFSTSSVTNMILMFHGDTNLSEINLSSFDTSNVKFMEGMFQGCSGLSSLDISSFSICDNCRISAYGYDIFAGCEKLLTIKTPKICDIEVEFPSGRVWYDDDNVEYKTFPKSTIEMTGTYGVVRKVSNDIVWIISEDGTLTISGTGEWKRECVPDGQNTHAPWWEYRTQVRRAEIELTEVSDLSGMFCDFEQLSSVVFITVDTTNVTNMNGMFEGCANLSEIDLSLFDATNVINMKDIFVDCKSLSKITTPNNVYLDELLPNDRVWKDYDENIYTRYPSYSEVLFANPIASGNSNNIHWVIHEDGKVVISGNGNWNTKLYSDYDFEGPEWLEYKDSIISAEVNILGETSLKNMFYSCINLKTVDISQMDTSDVSDMSGMFANCSNLEKIDLSNIITTIDTRMTNMFTNCTRLSTLITPNNFCLDESLPLGKVWKDCEGIEYTKFPGTSKTLFINPIATGKSNNVFWALDEHGKLTVYGNGDWSHISFPEFGIAGPAWIEYKDDIISAEVYLTGTTSSAAMFNSCSNLLSVEFYKFDTSKVASMESMFYKCASLEKVNLHGFDTKNVTTMMNMFYGCSAIKQLDLSSFDTSKVKKMTGMFSGCENISELNLSNFSTESIDVENGRSLENMFEGCKKLTSLDISGFTTLPYDMSGFFAGLENLTTVDFHNWDTSTVHIMDSLFLNCKKVESIDLSSFDLSNVSSVSNMFWRCENLENLNISSLEIKENTDVTQFYNVGFFEGCNKLSKIVTPKTCAQEIELPIHSKWLDSKNNVFKFLPNESVSLLGKPHIYHLRQSEYNFDYFIDYDGNLYLNTDAHMVKLTYSKKGDEQDGNYLPITAGSFYQDKVKTAEIYMKETSSNLSFLFYNCENLVSAKISDLDLTDSYNVSSVSHMFSGCKSLKDVDFSTVIFRENVTSDQLFKGCVELEKIITPLECNGVIQLPTDKIWTDKDGKVYFTFPQNSVELFGRKNIAGGLSGKVNWFIDENGHLLISGNGNWEKEDFVNDDAQIEQHAPWWKYREQIFSAEIKLTDTTDASEMLYGCSELTQVNLSEFDTSKLTDVSGMFVGCTSLTALDLSNFEITENCATNMFASMDNLISIVTPKSCKAIVTLPTGKTWNDKYDVKYSHFPETTIILYSDGSCDRHTIQYEMNGGTNNVLNPTLIRRNETITLKKPTKVGYTFDGWYDKETDEKVTKVVQRSIIVYAKWIPYTYTVTFSGNGGTYLPEGVKKSVKEYKQNFTFDVEDSLQINAFSRKGYTFVGWNTKANGSGVSYSDNRNVKRLVKTNKGNLKLYAQWVANDYAILFDANFDDASTDDITGEMDIIEVKYNQKVKLPANSFARKGYTFKGWSKTSDGKVAFKNKASVKNLASEADDQVTLYAVWSINTYSVKYNANGAKKGKAPSAVKNLKYGENKITIAENPFTFNDNYSFVGWNTKKDGTGDFCEIGKTMDLVATKNKQTITLYATWKYSLTYDINGGTGENVVDYECIYNKNVDTSDHGFVKEGYTLAGWNTSQTSANKGKVQYKVNAVAKNLGGKTLYAVWKQNK